MSLLWAILLISVLVTVHELGHFVVAKLFDVKVLRLSLGFGPRLIKLRGRETEYAISAVPLGGYVKMLGEDPDDEIKPSDQGRAFPHKPLWQRLVIVLAGPAANLVFPAVIYFQYYVDQDTALSSTIGVVFEGQPAAGVLEPGDRVIAIDDEAVRYWDDVNRLVGEAPGRDLRITVERPGEDKPITKVVTPRAHQRRDLLGKPVRVGQIGVAPHFRRAQIGVAGVAGVASGQPSPAARAGLRTFDVITSVQGRPVASWHDLEVSLAANRGEAMVVTWLRGAGAVPPFAAIERLEPGSAQIFPDRVVENGRARYDTGIHSGEVFVHDVEPGSPAAQAGIQPGDELTTLDGAPLRHWELLQQTFEEQPERAFVIGWRTGNGEPREAPVQLQPRTRRDEYQTESTLYVFGAEPARATRAVPSVAIEGRVGRAVAAAVGRTVDRTWTLLKILALLVVGRVPATAIGGPIMLFQVAGVAASRGADEFSEMVALISLNLGLLNLLPVPVLDGGQALFLGIEAARRRPIGRRLRSRAALLGWALLVALTLLAARNDVVRYWFKS